MCVCVYVYVHIYIKHHTAHYMGEGPPKDMDDIHAQ